MLMTLPHKIVSFETYDPRHNFDDWFFSQDADTRNAKNTQCNPSSGSDSEGDVSPELISTAYTRSEPIESPWELGLIHRGARWQTINLQKYDSSGDYGVGGMSTTYSNGDANILDQIKMKIPSDNQKQTFGLVPLTAERTEVFTALVADIKRGSDITSAGDPVDGGTIISVSAAKTLAEDLITYLDGLTKPIKVRSEIVGFSSLIAGTSDADKEELVGKFINLSKAAGGATSYEILIVAQSIKDIGATASITIKKALEDGTTTSVVDPKMKQYDQYADEILAE